MAIDRKTLAETGLATASVRGRTAARTCRCRALVGGQIVADVAIGSRPVVVGAGADCDVILPDPQASRRHAELSLLAAGVRVRDLGSTNGTFVHAARVTEVVVPLDGAIRIGGTTLSLSSGDLPTVAPSERRRFGGMVGRSLAMRELFAVLELAAPTDATVLLCGESGTGKELAARALHDHSPRARVPLVVVDCGAITESLLDSQLFGHVRGAFTGADRDRNGAFVEADGGTVLLDEIGELPPAAQAKLLRALESRTVQPVGSDRPVAIDVRIVAATHRDLAQMVATGQFRFDLFYRLAVVHAIVPPLRERLDDLPGLVEHFYEGRRVEPGPIDGDNLAALERHAWPGNVRELRNVLERAWAMSGGGARFRELPLWVHAAAHGERPDTAAAAVDVTLPFKEAKERWNDAFERRYVEALFDDAGRNITRAAARADVSRRHFRELLRKHGIVAGDDDA
jgi:transcriptional regulator with GAF, ATPase, and Fis domain